MEFQSLSFILLSFLAIFIYNFLPLKTKPLAHIILGIGFIYSFLDWERLTFLFVLITLIYFLLKNNIQKKNPLIIFICFGLIVGTFFTFKIDLNFLNQHPFFSIIGISYLCLKLYHFTSDIKNEAYTDIKFFHYLGYIFFYPTFLAGPITRYNIFTQCYTETTKNNLNITLISFMRILSGIFKKFVLSAWLFPFILSSIDIEAASRVQLACSTIAYSLYIYFDFAGYTDIARGLGRLLGADIPPNFRYPYLRKNIIDFWAHWHISLSEWLRDYIYLPFSLFIARSKFPFKQKGYIFANLTTMFICGIWHGITWNFALWGLYHGIGLSFVRGLDLFLKKRKSLYTIHHKIVSPLFSCFINFIFVSFGWIFFCLPISEAWQVIKILLIGRLQI